MSNGGGVDNDSSITVNSDSSAPAADEVQQVNGRQIININDGWTFSTNDTSSDGWGFPDGRGAGTVDLPHSWEYVHPTKSYIPAFNKKTATYQKVLNVSSFQHKRLYIKFYGVSKNADVFVDGVSLGQHVGGYSAFTFDLTDQIRGKDQVTLTVNVTNVDTDSIPINVDYTQWAGIYRDVELIATDDQHFSLNNYGSDGIFVSYALNGSSANATVRADVANNADACDLTLVTQFVDASGRVVSSISTPFSCAAQKDYAEISVSHKLGNLHLWNGVSDPYLYTVKAQLLDSNGTVLDEVSKDIGFRTFTISKGKAYLNGKCIQIHGVGYHQDREGCGNAVTSEQISSDFDEMLEMGVNFVRASHYPHDRAFYDFANKRGLLVYEEIPYYMIYSKADSYRNSIKNQLIEMIRQNYNSPCVVMNGIQNEVVYNASFKNYGADFDVSQSQIISFNKELAALAHTEDSSRMVVQATIDGASHAKVSKQWSGNIDLTGLNLYVGFKSAVYSAGDNGRRDLKKQLNEKLDSYKSIYGVDSLMISEYGAGANINQHIEVDDGFSWSGKDSVSEHYEDYQSFVHETYWDLISSRKDIPVSSVWNMFDFSCYRNEGGVPRTNTKGLICYDHQSKKDAFYFYKANWNKTDPFVYLTSKRFKNRNRSSQNIKVYSNLDSVELFVNGESQGTGKKQQTGVFVWKNVGLVAGQNNSIKAVASAHGVSYSDGVDDITVPASLVSYKVHASKIGWEGEVSSGVSAGSTGDSIPLEALSVKLSGVSGSIMAKGHVQNIGWQKWAKSICGTTGRGKRLEAIRLRLSGDAASDYDIWYCVHAAGYGWLGWTKNGEPAGTSGKSAAIEAVRIVLTKKGETPAGSTDKPFIGIDKYLTYAAHVQKIGWQSEVSDGATAGTTGRGLSMEALRAEVSSDPDALCMQAHVANIGWQQWTTGECGTTGQSRQLEAIKFKLSHGLEDKYDIYYRAHVAHFGWLGWAKNGEPAGTTGFAYGLQAVEIQLVEKGSKAPGSTSRAYIEPLVSYSAHVATIGWMPSVKDGTVSGTTGRGLQLEALKLSLVSGLSGSIEAKAHVARIGWQDGWSGSVGTTGRGLALEAVRIRLTGDVADSYDVYYRVHSSNIGWSKWVKNGEVAGTTGRSLAAQAVQVELRPK